MRATLIHNPAAGSGKPTDTELIAWLEAAGYDVRYASSKRNDYPDALEESSDLIVVAGGDGTIAKVATRIVGRDVPLAIVPVGTANNIATTLGIRGKPEGIIRALPSAERRRFDAGTASAPWGTSRFLESAGVGLFAAMLEHAERTAELRKSEQPGAQKRARSARATQRLLERQPALFCQVEADGVNLSGNYILAIAMNTRRIGSCLELAPDADVSDGQLDLVLLGEEQRDTLRDYLGELASGGDARFPLAPRRARSVRFNWYPKFGHLDDERWPEEPGGQNDREAKLVELAIIDPPFTVLV
jgi:diacylglycerol kinase family enzyme